MFYACTAAVILLALVVAGRVALRRLAGVPIPARDLLPPQEPVTFNFRPAPGAPNTDPPTARHVTERGTARIHRRTGRRRTTTVG